LWFVEKTYRLKQNEGEEINTGIQGENQIIKFQNINGMSCH